MLFACTKHVHQVDSGQTFTGVAYVAAPTLNAASDQAAGYTEATFAPANGKGGLFDFGVVTRARKVIALDFHLAASVAWTIEKLNAAGAVLALIVSGTSADGALTEADGIWLMPGEKLRLSAPSYGVACCTVIDKDARCF